MCQNEVSGHAFRIEWYNYVNSNWEDHVTFHPFGFVTGLFGRAIWSMIMWLWHRMLIFLVKFPFLFNFSMFITLIGLNFCKLKVYYWSSLFYYKNLLKSSLLHGSLWKNNENLKVICTSFLTIWCLCRFCF